MRARIAFDSALNEFPSFVLRLIVFIFLIKAEQGPRFKESLYTIAIPNRSLKIALPTRSLKIALLTRSLNIACKLRGNKSEKKMVLSTKGKNER